MHVHQGRDPRNDQQSADEDKAGNHREHGEAGQDERGDGDGDGPGDDDLLRAALSQPVHELAADAHASLAVVAAGPSGRIGETTARALEGGGLAFVSVFDELLQTVGLRDARRRSGHHFGHLGDCLIQIPDLVERLSHSGARGEVLGIDLDRGAELLDLLVVHRAQHPASLERGHEQQSDQDDEEQPGEDELQRDDRDEEADEDADYERAFDRTHRAIDVHANESTKEEARDNGGDDHGKDYEYSTEAQFSASYRVHSSRISQTSQGLDSVSRLNPRAIYELSAIVIPEVRIVAWKAGIVFSLVVLAVAVLVQSTVTKTQIYRISDVKGANRLGGTVAVEGKITYASDNVFILEDGTGKAEIATCPTWYQRVNLYDGDQVMIVGQVSDNPSLKIKTDFVLNAYKVFKGGQVIVVRGRPGKPPWINYRGPDESPAS